MILRLQFYAYFEPMITHPSHMLCVLIERTVTAKYFHGVIREISLFLTEKAFYPRLLYDIYLLAIFICKISI